MAGVVEVEKIVPQTEEKTTTEPKTETPKETVHTDDSATAVEVEIKGEEAPKVEKENGKTEKAPVKEQKPAAVVEEEKNVKPAAETLAVDGKAV